MTRLCEETRRMRAHGYRCRNDYEGVYGAVTCSVRFHHSLRSIALVHVMGMDLRYTAVARHGPLGVINHRGGRLTMQPRPRGILLASCRSSNAKNGRRIWKIRDGSVLEHFCVADNAIHNVKVAGIELFLGYCRFLVFA